jgi:leucyl-tRNA synthetase
MGVKKSIKTAIEKIGEQNYGKGKINFRLRDAIFGRQRYWGEPIPIYYKEGIPYPIPENDLPLVLPEIDTFLPTEEGDPPLGRASNWKYKGEYDYELTTMPGWAGSSWYFLRYMDSGNTTHFADKNITDYWKNIDVYIGGSEHATGHLLYVRFWTKFLYDLGYISVDEPAQKLINQGMIQGRSNYVYRIKDTNTYVSYGLKNKFETTALNVDVNIVQNDVLDIIAFKAWRVDFEDAEFILEDGKYICGVEIEKMSKSKWNVVTPDSIIDQYGADTLRLYEMFLGPLEQSKPWSTQGIEGVHRFLKKLWKLFFNAEGILNISDEEPTKQALKSIHKVIKKISDDIEQFSFNTSVSTFMICVNELSEMRCQNKTILKDLLICLSPFAPHISQELWKELGYNNLVVDEAYPVYKPEYMVEDSFSYPISINGKHRTNIEFNLQADQKVIEEMVLADDIVKKWLENAIPKKVIFVKGKIINIVI